MEKAILANKGGIFLKLLKKLKEKEAESTKSYLSFPHAFEALCSPFILTKQDAWEVLMILRDLSLIEFVPCHGIRTRFKIKDEK